jgi:hypothetical protein
VQLVFRRWRFGRLVLDGLNPKFEARQRQDHIPRAIEQPPVRRVAFAPDSLSGLAVAGAAVEGQFDISSATFAVQD